MIIFQISTNIKYLIIKYSKKICEIESYSGILKLKTDNITVYNIENFLEYYYDFDDISFQEIIIYESSSNHSINNLSFRYKEKNFSEIFYFSNVDIFIKQCLDYNIKCTEEFINARIVASILEKI